jgi:hypothetical protein
LTNRWTSAAAFAALACFGLAETARASDAGVSADAAGGKAAPPAAILRAPALPASEEPARFVLVRAGAMLHTALPPGGRRLRLPALAIESDSPQATARFRVVRSAGDWIELETSAVDPVQPHCHAPPAAFAGLALRLYVSAADLQPVTSRRVHLAFEGGGAIDLEPGVPVKQAGDHWQIFADANTLTIDLAAVPADAVGAVYAPALARAIPETAHVLVSPSRLTVGGLKLTTDARRSETQGEWSAGRDGALAAYVQASVPGREHRLGVGVQTGCASYRGTVEAKALGDAQAPTENQWLLGHGGRNRFHARAGAALRWPDGGAAGHVTAELPIPGEAHLDRKRPCFDWPLATEASESDATLRLCLAPGDVVESPAFLTDQQASAPTPQTRRQVALAIDNQTARPAREVETAVRTAARRRLFALGDVVLVPPGEEPARSTARAQKNGLAQYRVELRIEETLGAPGEMTQRLVAAKLIRVDGTPAGKTVKSDQSQQIQSTGDAAKEKDALEEILDEAMLQMAEALRGEK